MAESSRFGTKYTCFNCKAKFYDLNRPKAVCPKCGADQAKKKATKTEKIVDDELEDAVEKVVEEEEDDVGVGDEVDLDFGDDELPQMEEELGYDESEDVAD